MGEETVKQIFEVTLSAGRSTTGSSPFLRDVWHGALKVDRWLDDGFKPGDMVRITVEKAEAKKK